MRRLLILLCLVGSITGSSTLALGADKLRVGFPSLATALSPTWVAAKKGFWKKYDPDVQLIRCPAP